VSYRYTILWVAFLDPSDSYFLFADLVGFYTHWTYMHIFRPENKFTMEQINYLTCLFRNSEITRVEYVKCIALKFRARADLWLTCTVYQTVCVRWISFIMWWTYMHIFRPIFLSNYWWQRFDIWSQASYRYPISWEAFLDQSDSYFLFAEKRGYHKWALSHSSSCFI
jgi:hypothetical protein